VLSSFVKSALSRKGTDGELLSLVAGGLLWGTGGVSGTLLARSAHLEPLAVASYRLAGGGLSLLVLLACTGALRWPSRAAFRRVLTLAGLAALYQAAYFIAMPMIGVGLATVVTLGAAPVFVLVAEAVILRRLPGRLTGGATVLALAGLGLLVGGPAPIPGAGSLFGGIALALGAAAAFGATTLLGRYPVSDLTDQYSVGLTFTIAAVPLLVASACTGGLAFHPTVASLGLLAYLGLVPTALAYVLFFRGLRGVSAGSASVVLVLEPVTAALLGVLLLGERMSGWQVVGAVLLCLAALIAGRRAD
jgi:DME family drug/metabolite transporter